MRKHNAAPPVGVYINDNRRLNVLELSAHVPREDALPACNRVPLEQRLHDLLGVLKADAWPVHSERNRRKSDTNSKMRLIAR